MKKIVVTLCLSGAFACGSQPKVVEEKPVEKAPLSSDCVKLHADLSKKPMAAMMFEPVPEMETLRFVTMNYRGIPVPVPVEEPQDVLVSSVNAGLEVLIVYKNQDTLIMLAPAETSGVSEHIASYEYGPNDVSCEEPDKVKQLVLKTMARPFTPEHAYKLQEGVMLEGEADGKRNFSWLLPDGTQIEYRGERKGFAAAVGSSGSGVVWVDTINTLLANPTLETVATTKESLGKLGFGTATMKKLDELSARLSAKVELPAQ